MKTTIKFLFIAILATGCSDADPDDLDPGGDGDGDGDGDSCTSGCTLSGECRPGNVADACGFGGEICQVCGDGQSCEGGDCVIAAPGGCSPETCDGCCDGDVCLSGTSGASCGSGGEACSDCGPRGVCETDPAANTCEVDPASRWDLIAVRGTLPETNEGGGTWDPGGGLPDGFARGELDGERTDETGSVGNTLTPTWNEPVAVGIRASDITDVVVEILDDDIDADDLIGRCSLPDFSFDAFDGSERSLSCPNGAGWQMVMVLEPQ
jgi:hypothetical protein